MGPCVSFWGPQGWGQLRGDLEWGWQAGLGDIGALGGSWPGAGPQRGRKSRILLPKSQVSRAQLTGWVPMTGAVLMLRFWGTSITSVTTAPDPAPKGPRLV